MGEDDLDQSTKAAHRHKLDMGHLDGCTKNKNASNKEIQHSLRQEISLLEKGLQDQVSLRCALEKSLRYKASAHNITKTDAAVPKPVTELIKEITVLEIEVGQLEQYLLSLYRKAFDKQTTSLFSSKKDEGLKPPIGTPRRRRLDFSRSGITSVRENFAPEAETLTVSNSSKETNGPSEDKFINTDVQRSHSSMSQPVQALGKAVRACHSQPLSVMEYVQNASSNVISLAGHLCTRISDHIPETANKLSEEMVRCMSNIYCKLANNPAANRGHLSPISSLSSMSAFSPNDQYDSWSPGFRNDSSFNFQLDNPFHMDGLKDFSRPYSTMVEVHCLYRDSEKLGDIEYLLQNFRSIISRLEEIDPKKMSHEEKLAFWINVHNALVMHAFLAYGVPQNNLKRILLLLKASYNVGGQIVSADAIESSILGCRNMSRPGQWLRLLLASKMKFKEGDERQAYAIEHPEPLVYFALSSGSRSDPAVRIYTSKNVLQELEVAKEDYIRATFEIRKDHKIILPKIVEFFSKDSGLCHAALMEMIQQCLPDSLRKIIKKHQLGKTCKNIEWIPHNFAFRYRMLKDLHTGGLQIANRIS